MTNIHKIKLVSAMFIFGSVGLFVKAIDLPSPVIVLMRTIIGSLFLLIVILMNKQKIRMKTIKDNIKILLLNGIALGGNWVFLFEAYRYTTVSAATLIYYCAPMIVLIFSFVFLKEKLSWKQIGGIGAGIFGMVIVNGVGIGGINPSLGLIFGFISALFYAGVMILNKFIRDLSSLESTFLQLLVATFIMISYIIISFDGNILLGITQKEILLIIILGVVHTGVACYLYFSSMANLPGQTIALLSYIDPVSALFFSGLFLKERLTIIQMIGAFLILGGIGIGELDFKNR